MPSLYREGNRGVRRRSRGEHKDRYACELDRLRTEMVARTFPKVAFEGGLAVVELPDEPCETLATRSKLSGFQVPRFARWALHDIGEA